MSRYDDEHDLLADDDHDYVPRAVEPEPLTREERIRQLIADTRARLREVR